MKKRKKSSPALGLMMNSGLELGPAGASALIIELNFDLSTRQAQVRMSFLLLLTRFHTASQAGLRQLTISSATQPQVLTILR